MAIWSGKRRSLFEIPAQDFTPQAQEDCHPYQLGVAQKKMDLSLQIIVLCPHHGTLNASMSVTLATSKLNMLP